jgi:EAL domain-containing protein (putative c-di-GMP-specific phosphodiesterase class I)
VSVNVGSTQLRSPHFPGFVADVLSCTGVAPEALTIEVTESSVASPTTDVTDALGRLQRHGVRIALDDFGTGESVLARLAAMPCDELKLDRRFLHGIDAVRSRAVAYAVCSLGAALGLGVVAEGIEDAHQLHVLRSFGCDYGQGYLLCPPLPYDELVDVLAGDRDDARPVAGLRTTVIRELVPA